MWTVETMWTVESEETGTVPAGLWRPGGPPVGVLLPRIVSSVPIRAR